MKTLTYVKDKALAGIAGGDEGTIGNGPFAEFIFDIVNADSKEERKEAVAALVAVNGGIHEPRRK